MVHNATTYMAASLYDEPTLLTADASSTEARKVATSCCEGGQTAYTHFGTSVIDLARELDSETRNSIDSMQGFANSASHSLFAGGFLKGIVKVATSALFAITQFVKAFVNLVTSPFRDNPSAVRDTALAQAKAALAGLVSAARGAFQAIPVAGNVILALGDKLFNATIGEKEVEGSTTTMPGTLEDRLAFFRSQHGDRAKLAKSFEAWRAKPTTT